MEKTDILAHYGVKGQKWGVRRYQNEDGSLTSKGQARYDRDKRENAAKKKENRIDLSEPDPKRWVKEDLERSKKTVDAADNAVKAFKTHLDTMTAKKKDLSQMSDKEMREQINRKLLERQYNQLFNEMPPSQISKGREALQKTLEVTGNVLTVASTAIAIATAIKELKG